MYQKLFEKFMQISGIAVSCSTPRHTEIRDLYEEDERGLRRHNSAF